ncbi:major facilitator superfamily domain-containing protein 6 isoform X1 [Lingula anatina]|uniref:Major facilitator superfamily domain-containing protein 6 isoform X1 n=1 Tax=Lingula anatina TaxID=7574 RepID=A0A1S3H9D2_LINAN|nr:major facilitator superfamily domain-containing protein 6 isoform X2 [Lingula anatina]XP_013382613.1 major facilitator superfamily domain-containing protein 6 isoform X1 [Lingula anatina]|eukprot:XP_013382612.1 major facilitator superfamily domain-containing protein 6 isoform X2 [Lingula anatina]
MMKKKASCTCSPVINKQLLPCKAFYFLFMAGVASLLPYLTVYMKHIGLTASESAIIYGVMPFLGFLIRPIWGVIADKFNKHKIVLIVCALFAGTFHVTCLFVPHVEPELVPVHVFFHANSSSATVSKCQLYGMNVEDLDLHGKCEESVLKENTLKATRLCNLTCTVLDTLMNDGSETSLQFCNSTANYCLELFDSNLVNVEDVSLELIFLNSTSDKISVLPWKDCPQYSIESFRANNTYFDVFKVQNELNMKCQIQYCNKNYSQNEVINDSKISSHDLTFGLFLVLFFIGQTFYMPCLSINDAITYGILGDEGSKWGRTRMFGTIGFATFAVISGLFMDSFSESESQPDFSPAFYLHGGMLLLAAISSKFMHIAEDVHCSQMMKNLSLLFKDTEICLFLFVMLILGIYAGVLMSFLFWYLGELCSPKLLMGLTLLVECVAETPMLYFAGFIIKKVGHIPCLHVTLLAYALRFGAYSFLKEPWLVLLIEPLHGITYGLLFSAATEYTDIIAPPGMSATLQGLMAGIHWGMGLGIGSLVAGQLYHAYGGVVMFRCFAFSSLIVLVIVWPLEKFVVRKKHVKKEHTEEEEDKENNQKIPETAEEIPLSADEENGVNLLSLEQNENQERETEGENQDENRKISLVENSVA